MRIADNNNIILLNDLVEKHKLSFSPTLKDNKDAALNNMRMLLRSGRIIIHPRCISLIAHLQGAIWNKDRTKYARSSDKGHYDLVDSCVYLCRNVNFNKNPYPNGYQYSGKEMYYVEDKPKEAASEFESSLSRMMRARNPMRKNQSMTSYDKTVNKIVRKKLY